MVPNSKNLLTRDQFREGVFARDHDKCVMCSEPAADAHHIMERRLWEDGGYYLDNGASVCPACHLKCEDTSISVEDLVEAIGIQTRLTPQHLYPDHEYDKWGNCILQNGNRTKGELYHRDTVQKILKDVEYLFTDYVKYPRTYHLPWSQGITNDDRTSSAMNNWIGKRVIATEKMDGENTSMYPTGIHARSVDGRHHSSRDWVKNYWGGIAHNIPPGMRVCGENMFAEHSIKYDELESYFYGFSVWDQTTCLSWDESIESCSS